MTFYYMDAAVCLTCECWVVPGPHPRTTPVPPAVARRLGTDGEPALLASGELCDGPYSTIPTEQMRAS